MLAIPYLEIRASVASAFSENYHANENAINSATSLPVICRIVSLLGNSAIIPTVRTIHVLACVYHCRVIRIFEVCSFKNVGSG